MFRTFVSLTLLSVSALAVADDWPYVRIKCDAKALAIFIDEGNADSETGIPTAKGTQSLYALTEVKTTDGPSGIQDFVVRKRDFLFNCNIAGAKYKLVVSPWKVSPKVNGMCGGYSPSTQLSVWRNGVKLVDKLVFKGYCNPPDSDYGIGSIGFSEKTESVTFFMGDDKGDYQKEMGFKQLDGLDRGELVRDQ